MTIYTQHELTPAEIRRDAAKNRAIARNRAKSPAVKAQANGQIFIKDPSLPATDPQKGKIHALLAQLARVDHTTWQTASAWVDSKLADMNMGLASQTIDRLKLRIAEAGGQSVAVTHGAVCTHGEPFGAQCNRAEEPAPTYTRTPRDKFTDVPDGYYAVMADAGHLAFYRVSTWKSGDRKVQVQASDELHPIKGRAAADGVLAKVRTDTPEVAGKRYADELGNCWRCGRTLTDDTSRALGIGPVCRNK